LQAVFQKQTRGWAFYLYTPQLGIDGNYIQTLIGTYFLPLGINIHFDIEDSMILWTLEEAPNVNHVYMIQDDHGEQQIRDFRNKYEKAFDTPLQTSTI